MGFFFKVPFGEEKLDFLVLLDVSLPRRTSVCIGEGVNLLREDWLFASEMIVCLSKGVYLGMGIYA